MVIKVFPFHLLLTLLASRPIMGAESHLELAMASGGSPMSGQTAFVSQRSGVLESAARRGAPRLRERGARITLLPPAAVVIIGVCIAVAHQRSLVTRRDRSHRRSSMNAGRESEDGAIDRTRRMKAT